MQKAVVVRGRMVSPTIIELDEPVTDMTGSVEVVLRSVEMTPAHAEKRLSDLLRRPLAEQDQPEESIFEFLRRLPPGSRTKEDIDRQLREERES